MSEGPISAFERLNSLLIRAGHKPLDPIQASRFESYLSLILRWNARVNLTAIRDEEGILSRHFVESITCARALPAGIATLLDFGSGAGFPGIPIALCRPEIDVTLAESRAKRQPFFRRRSAPLISPPKFIHKGHSCCRLHSIASRSAPSTAWSWPSRQPLSWFAQEAGLP